MPLILTPQIPPYYEINDSPPPGGAGKFTRVQNVASPINVTDTTETTLISYSIPANTLTTNGDQIKITQWGNSGENAGLPTFKIKINGSTIFSHTLDTTTDWKLFTEITRYANEANTCFQSWDFDDYGRPIVWYGTTIDWTDNVDIEITVQLTTPTGPGIFTQRNAYINQEKI